jgi:hypothetical protein
MIKTIYYIRSLTVPYIDDFFSEFGAINSQ